MGATTAQKRTQRRELLQQAGIDLAPLTSIDWNVAALCTLTAHHAAAGGECLIHGEPESGLIIVPSCPSLMASSRGNRPDCAS